MDARPLFNPFDLSSLRASCEHGTSAGRVRTMAAAGDSPAETGLSTPLSAAPAAVCPGQHAGTELGSVPAPSLVSSSASGRGLNHRARFFPFAKTGATMQTIGRIFGSRKVWIAICGLAVVLAVQVFHADPHKADAISVAVVALSTVVIGAIGYEDGKEKGAAGGNAGPVVTNVTDASTSIGPKQGANALAGLALLSLLCLFAGGCQTLTGPTPAGAYVAADHATYDAVAPDHTNYVNADPNLSPDERARRLRTLESWKLRIDTEESRQSATVGATQLRRPRPPGPDDDGAEPLRRPPDADPDPAAVTRPFERVLKATAHCRLRGPMEPIDIANNLINGLKGRLGGVWDRSPRAAKDMLPADRAGLGGAAGRGPGHAADAGRPAAARPPQGRRPRPAHEPAVGRRQPGPGDRRGLLGRGPGRPRRGDRAGVRGDVTRACREDG
jgi:hypothetical protein